MPLVRLSASHEGSVPVEQRISADSHVGEPPDLWEKRLPKAFKDRAMRFPDIKPYETTYHLRAGAWDPHERLKDLAFDGISAEVLYPSFAKNAWGLGDAELEEACVRVYNDWMIEFCSVAPQRLWGLAMASLHDIDGAVKELERCKEEGLRAADIPALPEPDLPPYSSDHYEGFWAGAEALDMPVNMHINSGSGWRTGWPESGLLPFGAHKFNWMKAIADIVLSGVFDRYPKLKFVIAEAGVGWLPFFAQELDVYSASKSKLPMLPSEYIWRHVHGTFISDEVGGHLLSKYGQDNFMWSNDYPHPACIWPGASDAIERDLGHLSAEDREKVICGNAARLYNHGQLPPTADPPGEHQELDERWFKVHKALV